MIDLFLPSFFPTARKTCLSVTYETEDISADVVPFVISFCYADRVKKDATDELSLGFQDVPGLWRGEWFPERGAKLATSVRTENWYAPGDRHQLDCGRFKIDDMSSGGPPSTFTVSALAIGISSGIRKEEKSRAWENMWVSIIAGEIARMHDFELFFDSGYDPVLDRMIRSQSPIWRFSGACTSRRGCR